MTTLPKENIVERTRPISWITTAQKEFIKFPEKARSICLTALTIAAEGGKADIAKPLHGLGAGVFEIALPFRGDAFRVVLRRTNWRGNLGGARVSEKIDARNQDATTRN